MVWVLSPAGCTTCPIELQHILPSTYLYNQPSFNGAIHLAAILRFELVTEIPVEINQFEISYQPLQIIRTQTLCVGALEEFNDLAETDLERLAVVTKERRKGKLMSSLGKLKMTKRALQMASQGTAPALKMDALETMTVRQEQELLCVSMLHSLLKKKS